LDFGLEDPEAIKCFVFLDESEGDIIDFYGPCDMIRWARLRSSANRQPVGANLLVLPT
jgi:hypothetical protein